MVKHLELAYKSSPYNIDGNDFIFNSVDPTVSIFLNGVKPSITSLTPNDSYVNYNKNQFHNLLVLLDINTVRHMNYIHWMDNQMICALKLYTFLDLVYFYHSKLHIDPLKPL